MQVAGIGSVGPAASAATGGQVVVGHGIDFRRLLAGGVLLLALALVPLLALAGGGTERASAPTVAPSEREILDRLATAPVGFVENVGQAHSSVTHVAQGPGYAFAFGSDGVRVSLGKSLSVGLQFVGANEDAEAVLAGRPSGGRVDYLVGERSRWRTGLAAYPELVYRDLWPGVDMAFTGSKGALKYEFRLAPGADPSSIQLAYQGAQSLALSSGGALQVQTASGTLRDTAPVSYQHIDGRRVPVESSFSLGHGNGYGFAIGAYDHAKPLVIDPGLEYSTYLGGGALDSGLDILVRGHNAYVAGATFSPDFPATPNAFDTDHNGSQDAFVSKLDTRKSGLASLEYSTFLGGGGPDAALGIVLEGHDAYLTGFTGSPNFPVTANAYDTSPNGGGDAFLTRLDLSRGSAGLEYSTYLGGSQLEVGLGIAVDAGDNAHVTGTVMSPEFPTTANALDTSFNGGGIDGFVSRIDTGTAGTAGLEYSTFLGGAGPDSGREIQTRGGDSFLAGPTGSPDFPASANAFDNSFNGGGLDAFVTRLDTRRAGPAGLEYSTFLGGSGQEDTADRPGTSIAVLGNDAYVASVTTSPDFPVTLNAFDRTYNGDQDAFVSRLDTGDAGPAGLEYSTYLGGKRNDIGRGIAVKGGDAYTTGGTDSPNFPITDDAFQRDLAGGQDAFVTRLDTRRWRRRGLEYSTYLGGSADELGRGIVARRERAYVTGETFSPDFPVTGSAFDKIYNGGQDAFVSRVDTD